MANHEPLNDDRIGDATVQMTDRDAEAWNRNELDTENSEAVYLGSLSSDVGGIVSLEGAIRLGAVSEDHEAIPVSEPCDGDEDRLIAALLAECGEEATWENVFGFRTNHRGEAITDAANGDVEAIIELRTACGLPVLS